MIDVLEGVKLRAQRLPLPNHYHALALHSPLHLLDPQHATLRTAIIDISDKAFGTSTQHLWDAKFTPNFLQPLVRFYLIIDPQGQLVGWSGYRARTIAGERVVHFTSTGLAPRCQGQRLIPALQRIAVTREARRHPLRAVTTSVRTRNPHSYQLALRTFGDEPVVPDLSGRVSVTRQGLVAAIGSWLDFADIDASTARVRDAYSAAAGLYGNEPRSGDQSVDWLFAQLGPNDALLVLGRRSRANALRLAVSSPQRGLADRTRSSERDRADHQRQIVA
jgi:hypothetical protein